MNQQQVRNGISDELLGTECELCGSSKRLVCHRKDGQPHKKFSLFGAKQFRSALSTGEFVRVCYICHKHIHWAMTWFGYSYDQIKDRVGVA